MQHSLAALFAARCTPGRWAVHATSMSAWHFVRQFTEFLAHQQRAAGTVVPFPGRGPARPGD